MESCNTRDIAPKAATNGLSEFLYWNDTFSVLPPFNFTVSLPVTKGFAALRITPTSYAVKCLFLIHTKYLC